MRKMFSVLCYIVAGFFIHTVILFSFINDPKIGAGKFAVMGVFAVPALGSLLAGLGLSRFRHWRRDIGIVFLSASGFTAFEALTIGSMLASPEFAKQFPDHKLGFFSDYVLGFGSILLLAMFGGLLLWQHSRSRTQAA